MGLNPGHAEGEAGVQSQLEGDRSELFADRFFVMERGSASCPRRFEAFNALSQKPANGRRLKFGIFDLDFEVCQ
jgi:hypothetical protein